jgi:hypothetical protein
MRVDDHDFDSELTNSEAQRMRNRFSLTTGVLCISLLVAVGSTQASLTDRSSQVPPQHDSMQPPAAGESYVDPVFDETIWRVTDALGATSFDFLTTEYSSQSPTNADDTIVRVSSNRGSVSFYSTVPPFNHLRTASLQSSSPSDYWWHPTDPNILYHLVSNGEFRAYNFGTDSDTVVVRLPFNNVAGLGENQLSLDGNRLTATANNRSVVFVYELSTNSVIAQFDSSALTIGDLSMSPDGTRVLVHHNPPGGPGNMHVYGIGNGTLNFERNLGQGYGHKDLGQSPSGEDYLLAVDSWFTNEVRAVRLSDGETKTIIPLGWTAPSNIALHVSANSMLNDGYVYISTYVPTESDPSVFWPAYSNEIMRVQYTGGVVERLAHTRSRYDASTGDTYFTTPRAAVSRSGKLLFWASNFRRRLREPNIPANHVDVYMMAPPPPPSIPPTAPSSLQTVTGVGGGTLSLGGPGDSLVVRTRSWASIGLSWNDNSQNEDSFRIFRSSDSAAYEFVAAVPANERSFKDIVEPGREYCFRVFASNQAGNSASNEACANVE